MIFIFLFICCLQSLQASDVTFFYSKSSQETIRNGSFSNPFKFLNESLTELDNHKTENIILLMLTDFDVFSMNPNDFLFLEFKNIRFIIFLKIYSH